MKRLWPILLCICICCCGTQMLYGQQPAVTTNTTDSVDATTPLAISPQVAFNREDSLKVLIDSLDELMQADPTLNTLGHLLFARLPIGKVDVDLSRIFAINPYEGIRLGIGVYTNNKLSPFVSIGGWVGYGFRDDRWKYGLSAKWFPSANKEQWLEAYYQDNYQNPGSVRIHKELDRTGLRNWTLRQVDRIKEAGLTAHTRIGIAEVTANVFIQNLLPQYQYTLFMPGSDAYNIKVAEANIGLRLAYGEDRISLLGRSISLGTKYPILYGRVAYGSLQSGTYSTSYWRALAAISYKLSLRHFGKAYFKLEGGAILADKSSNALPRSFLLAGNGYQNDAVYWYAPGGFITMYPYTYYSDRYASLLFRYDFDWRLYETAFSSPYLGLAYNALVGYMERSNYVANPSLIVPNKGYQEAGVLLHSLLRIRYFGVAYLNFGAGAFYHLGAQGGWPQNGKFVVGTNISI